MLDMSHNGMQMLCLLHLLQQLQLLRSGGQTGFPCMHDVMSGGKEWGAG